MGRKGERFAWLRLNAYGVLLAALCLLNLKALINPAGTEFAILVGDVPPGQAVWVTGFVIAGMLLLAGFIRGDRIAETLGLALIALGVVAQTIAAFARLGNTEFSNTQAMIVGVVGLCVWARCSALWSRRGLTIHIPARVPGEESGDER